MTATRFGSYNSDTSVRFPWTGACTLMRMPSLPTATNLLLTALVLMASVAPPAVRHVHPVAEGSHWHHDHGDHSHAPHQADHRHGAASTERHGHHAVLRHPMAAAVAVQSGHWHLHLVFLGIEITLPDRFPQKQDRGPQPSVEWVLQRASENLPPPQTSRPAPSELLVAAPLPPSLGDASPFQAVSPLSPQVATAPLCDRARLERSGVLLA